MLSIYYLTNDVFFFLSKQHNPKILKSNRCEVILDVTNTRNGERGTGNGERGTGNGSLGTSVQRQPS